MEYNIGIITTEFNSDITMPMLDVAKEHVSFLGGKTVTVVKVPGSFDMPLAIKRLLESEKVDAVITLGAVIEGDTDHDNIVAQNAARKIADLSVQYDKPVSLGVMGPKMTRQDAIKRINRYAKGSVEAAFKMLNAIKNIK